MRLLVIRGEGIVQPHRWDTGRALHTCQPHRWSVLRGTPLCHPHRWAIAEVKATRLQQPTTAQQRKRDPTHQPHLLVTEMSTAIRGAGHRPAASLGQWPRQPHMPAASLEHVCGGTPPICSPPASVGNTDRQNYAPTTAYNYTAQARPYTPTASLGDWDSYLPPASVG